MAVNVVVVVVGVVVVGRRESGVAIARRREVKVCSTRGVEGSGIAMVKVDACGEKGRSDNNASLNRRSG